MIYLFILQHFEPCDNEQFVTIKNIIVKNKLISFVYGMVMNKIKEDLMSKINDFWLYFIPDSVIELTTLKTLKTIPEDFTGFEKFKTAIIKLFDVVISYDDIIKRLQMLFEDNKINILKNMIAQICAILHSRLPSDYNTIIYQFYRAAFKVFTKDDDVGGMYEYLQKYNI